MMFLSQNDAWPTGSCPCACVLQMYACYYLLISGQLEMERKVMRALTVRLGRHRQHASVNVVLLMFDFVGRASSNSKVIASRTIVRRAVIIYYDITKLDFVYTRILHVKSTIENKNYFTVQ